MDERRSEVDRDERRSLVLAIARVLFVNGQSTNETVLAAERAGRIVGLPVKAFARWGEVRLQPEGSDANAASSIEAKPTGVAMNRVAAAMAVVDGLAAQHLSLSAAREKIVEASRMPPSPDWLFALAAAAGATALSVIFGLQHHMAAVLIFISAGAGAILRRILARHSSNLFVQPFAAALLAGVVGGISVRCQLSSTLRLVAVCPCMVLVPGPPVLNGALDLVRGRIHLGAARMLFAGLVILAISTGLLLGLSLLGVALPVDGASPPVPLWFDTLSAGIAVAAYSIFFSTPPRMLPWPVAVGMLAHASRWVTITMLGLSPAIGAMTACLLVGLILSPVSRRGHMPFAGIGFAAVVSMIPGVFLFRMASGLVQLARGSHTTMELLSGTIADGTTALTIILAMSFGLIASRMAMDHLQKVRQ